MTDKCTDELLRAIGNLACDLARGLTDADIQHDWKQIMENPAVLVTYVPLTPTQLMTLRETIEL